MTWNIGKNEEEEIFKRKLLYDGWGTGEDKRLVTILRNITKLCLTDDEESSKLTSIITKDIALNLLNCEKLSKISTMYDRTEDILQEALRTKADEIKRINDRLSSLHLELEYAAKYKQVNEYPACEITESLMREIVRKKEILMNKTAKLKSSISIIVDACSNLQKVLEDEICTDTEDSLPQHTSPENPPANP